MAAICSGTVKTTWKYSTVEQFGLPILEPLRAGERLALRAVPIAAAVVGDALVAAGVALLDVAAERGRAAALDGAS